MKQHTSLFILSVLLTVSLSCKRAAPEATEAPPAEVAEWYTVDGENIVIPTFEIEVSNSADAAQTLADEQETTIVAAYFSGIPNDEKDMDENMGFMSIVTKSVELTSGNRIARFEGLTFPKAIYNKLADKDIMLLINIYSGRRSSDDNLLNCGLLDVTVSQLSGKRYTLACKLIEEDSPAATGPVACYALPEAGAAANAQPALLVSCTEKGEISFAGQPVQSLDQLKAAIRAALVDWTNNGHTAFPDCQTTGCMMGTSGEIRTMYEEIKTELNQ